MRKNEHHDVVYTSKDEPILEDAGPHYCINCGEELEDLIPDHPTQHLNSIDIYFVGGYGAFYDVLPGEEPPHGEICHDCAHYLCDENLLMKKLLMNGHAHGINPDGSVQVDF
jgi:hypothetical protein